MAKSTKETNRDNKRAERQRYKDAGLVTYIRYYEPDLHNAMDLHYQSLKLTYRSKS